MARYVLKAYDVDGRLLGEVGENVRVDAMFPEAVGTLDPREPEVSSIRIMNGETTIAAFAVVDSLPVRRQIGVRTDGSR